MRILALKVRRKFFCGHWADVSSYESAYFWTHNSYNHCCTTVTLAPLSIIPHLCSASYNTCEFVSFYTLLCEKGQLTDRNSFMTDGLIRS